MRVGRTPVDTRRGPAEIAEALCRDRDQLVVTEVSGGADQDPIGPVSSIEKREKVIAAEAADRFRGARNRPRERVPRPESEVEKLVDVVVGRVLDLRYLLDDDRPLAFDLLGGEARIGEDIREYVEREPKMVRENLAVIASVFLACERVQHAADRVDLLRDVGGRAPLGAFEKEMLEEVRDAGLLRRLVAGPVFDPDPDGDRRQIGELLRQHPDTVRQPCSPHGLRGAPLGLRRRAS